MVESTGAPDHGTEAWTAVADGAVLGPDDPDYATVCAAWNLAWTQRPAMVVRARSENDVVQAVRHAAQRGLAVAIQTTGHGVTVPSDQDCLLIAMAGLDAVHIDPQRATATVGGGVTWAPVLAAAQRHGLAPLVGSSPHVGAVSYSMGGGFGWLARRYGLAVDAIRELRVVLADGSVVVASEADEPELFWALCGTGGGTLGVVTEMTVDLFPVTDVYAGSLFYSLDDAREVFRFYRDWSANAPAGLTSAFNITAFPPIDLVPEPLRAKTFVIVRGCFADAADPSAAALVDQWRQWKAPLIDMWGPMPFARCAEISQDPVDPLPAHTSGRWLTCLDDEVLDTMLEVIGGGAAPSPVLFTETRHAGAAVQDPRATVSYSGRGGEYCLEIVGLVFDPQADEEIDRRCAAAWDRLEAALAPVPGYLNFVEGDERVQMSRAAFPEPTRRRLAAAKQRYDRRNLFRYGIGLPE